MERESGGKPSPLNFDIVLIDFGLSIYYEDVSGDNSSRRGGKCRFQAPEMRLVTKYCRPTPKTDCFAWAAVTYNVRPSVSQVSCIKHLIPQMFTTIEPYSGIHTTDKSVILAIRGGELPARTVEVKVGGAFYSVTIPNGLWGLIDACWKNPEERITLHDILLRMRSLQVSLGDTAIVS